MYSRALQNADIPPQRVAIPEPVQNQARYSAPVQRHAHHQTARGTNPNQHAALRPRHSLGHWFLSQPWLRSILVETVLNGSSAGILKRTAEEDAEAENPEVEDPGKGNMEMATAEVEHTEIKVEILSELSGELSKAGNDTSQASG